MKNQRSLAVIVALTGLASSAVAQNALGDGRGLDNNLSRDSRFNEARPNLADELRFRNAIVTGNAIGGLSFRGDLGYQAPGEFRGELGSNDLFAFRRDSLNSGLAGMGIRGSEALQLQFAMTTGGRPPQNLVGSYALPREGYQPNTSGIRRSTGLGEGAIQTMTPELVESNSPFMGSLRASSAFEANRGYQPMLLGVEPPQEDGVNYGLAASELRGVSRIELSGPTTGTGRLDGSLPLERFETSYTVMMEQLRERAATLPVPEIDEDVDTRSPWEIRIEELRNQLLLPEDATGVEAEPVDSDAVVPGSPGTVEFDAETIGLLRRGGAPSTSFVVEGSEGIFAEHMRRAESYLRSGRYFDAEERFAHALTIMPNEVTAQLGRIHAQIGAGMYLSAALNLRTLLMEQPATVSARYDAALMPQGDRLVAVIEQLREGISRAEIESPVSGDLRRARAAGILLAYVGIQLGDATMVVDGTKAARAAIDRSRSGDDDVANENERRVLDLIDAVWANTRPE